ncbi:MAG TPA: hypothetical protein RMH99_08015 [Sandaracinaceae bacterium LLY-WYZ-13_1]|nr:hypothetical protein [Sandaracinaceae bacterium LLY-WYZ-13_1]
MLANLGKPLRRPVSTSTAAASPAAGDDAGSGGDTASASEGAALPALPASTTPETVPAAALMALSQLQDLFRSPTSEQTQQISSVLTPAQQGSLLTLYQLFAGLDDELRWLWRMGPDPHLARAP